MLRDREAEQVSDGAQPGQPQILLPREEGGKSREGVWRVAAAGGLHCGLGTRWRLTASEQALPVRRASLWPPRSRLEDG